MSTNALTAAELHEATASDACPCACCVEHDRAVAHGRDGIACHCNVHDEDERCDCDFCRSWLERTERCEQCGAVINGFHAHPRFIGEGN